MLNYLSTFQLTESTRCRRTKPKFGCNNYTTVCLKLMNNILFKIISIAIYIFLPPLWQAINAAPKKKVLMKRSSHHFLTNRRHIVQQGCVPVMRTDDNWKLMGKFWFHTSKPDTFLCLLTIFFSQPNLICFLKDLILAMN